MSRVYTTTLRFNLDRPGDQTALEYLQGVGKEEYKSLNKAVIAAVNDCFSRKVRLTADPYLETREKEDAFLRRVQETIERSLRAASTEMPAMPASEAEAGSAEDLDAAMDFISGF